MVNSGKQLIPCETKISAYTGETPMSPWPLRLTPFPRTSGFLILEFEASQKFEFSLIKGVMIHISPEHLAAVYKTLAQSSSRHVLIAEYYNRRPDEVLYREHSGKLFRRDFGGEFMDANPEFSLLDYGFSYHRDSRELQDDLTWFLFERKA